MRPLARKAGRKAVFGVCCAYPWVVVTVPPQSEFSLIWWPTPMVYLARRCGGDRHSQCHEYHGGVQRDHDLGVALRKPDNKRTSLRTTRRMQIHWLWRYRAEH
jgi:hypothetical protein